ncbi:hypothetical protein [Pseudoneobacillus sp. C159]
MKIFIIVLGIILAIDFIRVIIGLLFFDRSEKVSCNTCLQRVESSLIKCNSCGTFLEKKQVRQWWVVTYLENRHYRRMTNYVKKNNFWRG